MVNIRKIPGNQIETDKPQDKVSYPSSNERKTYPVKASNWDKLFPYMFMVVNADPGTGTARINFDAPERSNRVQEFDIFKLPINPQDLSISIPFAMHVTPTTRGILEEHNGVVFRNISIQGTTGITPGNLRSGGFKGAKDTGFVDAVKRGAISLASNTLGRVSDAVSAVGRAIQSATGSLPQLDSAVNEADEYAFGYAQLHQLLNYFVSYAEFKKKPENTNARLAFVNLKDNVAYIVTPISFDAVKSKDRPHIYDYKIMLKAWDIAGIVGEGETRNPFGFESLTNNPNLVTRLFNTTREARSVLSSASSAIKAVASDFENTYNIVGEVLLAVKDIGEFTQTIADFPELISSRWNRIARDFDDKIAEIQDEFTGGGTNQTERNTSSSISELSSAATSTQLSADPTNPSGAPLVGQTTKQQRDAQVKLDIQNPFNDSENTITHTDFLDNFALDEFVLEDSEEDLINTKLSNIRGRSIADYDAIRLKLEETRDAYADSRGLSDDDYNDMANRTTPLAAITTASTNDYDIIQAFNDIISVVDALSATNELIRRQVPDPFIRAQDTVEGSGIVIQDSNAAFPVPFPLNGSLEQLAQLYLGDPDRWIEIALLNDLKPPYIDEEGFTRFFTTSGSGNSFTISDGTDMFLGQEVFISSVTRRQERRLITKIDKLAENNFLITVDGEANLNAFTVVQQAKILAYKPNTVNSSKVIFIPFAANVPANENIPDTRQIPITSQLNKQEKLMGVDLRLTDDFDLALNNRNDIQLIAGFNNALQALRIKLAVEQGELGKHPEFGAGIGIGERFEASAADIKEILENAILSDSRFSAVPDIIVEFDGPKVILTLRVKVSNGGGVIPIQFVV